jgi:hypothetical protein
MWTLLIYLVVAGVAIGGVLAVVHKHDDGIRAKEAAVWQPRLAAAQADTKTAVDANLSLQGDLTRIAGDAKACSDKVQALGDVQKAAEAAKAKNLVDAGKTIGSLASDKAQTEARLAAATTKGEACDVQLAKVNDVLGELGARRLRDHPGANGSEPGRNAPAGQGSGSDSLRVGR